MKKKKYCSNGSLIYTSFLSFTEGLTLAHFPATFPANLFNFYFCFRGSIFSFLMKSSKFAFVLATIEDQFAVLVFEALESIQLSHLIYLFFKYVSIF